MTEWGFESLLYFGSLPAASIGEVHGLLLPILEGQGWCLCGSVPPLFGLPAGLGSQFSLSPGGRRQGRQSSEDEEDTGEREAKAVETRKELGDVNKSGVEGAPGEVEGWTKWLPGTVPTCRFYKIMGFTARSLYFLLSEPLIRVSVTIMIFLSRKIR